ncbi:hypothetical protein N7448_010306 [Penicillium atrosanguineum]|nr:hypothetical protein N7448_010306 [Penicillium atrosanguineum]
MDGSQGQAGQPMGQSQQHSNLIRTDQVQKLPHLTDQQKAQHTHVVRSLWELLNTRDPQTAEYQNAHMKLSQLSQNLMKGMRIFQQNRQQALQQQQAQAAVVQQTGQPVQRTQSNNPQNLSQLLPQIQAKVSSLNFYLPPNVTQEQVQTWIPEARLRYGIALQKQEVGRARIADLRTQFSQRQAQGAMPNDEVQEFKNRQLAAEKLFREGSEFLNKFKEQQESFKMQSQQNPQMNQSVQGTTAPAAQPAPTAPAAPQATQAPTANATSAMPGLPPTPAPHTINSAVNAARSQAGQTAMSPTTSQLGQAPSSASATPAPPNAQQPGQRPQPPSHQGTPGAQVTFTQTPQRRRFDSHINRTPASKQPSPRPAASTVAPSRDAAGSAELQREPKPTTTTSSHQPSRCKPAISPPRLPLQPIH